MEVQISHGLHNRHSPLQIKFFLLSLCGCPKSSILGFAQDTEFFPWALETAGAAELNDPAEMRANLNSSEAAF